MERFPSFEALADANESEVMALWQGLGYYRRASNLHKTARRVVEQGVPRSVADWRKLPGIGAYTAAAVASIAQGLPARLVDANVRRVFARVEASPEQGGRLEAAAWQWTEAEMDASDASTWNQALMELGALVCLPKDPKCEVCPLAPVCLARAGGMQESYPVRVPPTPVVAIRRDVLVRVHEGNVALRPRQRGEWWHGLWGLPEFSPESAVPIASFGHSVTRHKITTSVFVDGAPALPSECQWFCLDTLHDVGMPAPDRRALDAAMAHLGLQTRALEA